MSEAVAGLIAGTVTGAEATAVLDRLLRNTTDGLVYEAVDATAYAVRANLPRDVVRILPWSPVSNGPTGAVPETFWEKIGAAATTAVNVLLVGGQLVLDGLVALGTFLVDLAQAAWDWGMQGLGEVQAAAQEALEGARDNLIALRTWVLNELTTRFVSLVKDPDATSLSFLLDDPDGRSFAAQAAEDENHYTSVEQALWDGNLWYSILLEGDYVLSRVPISLDVVLFSFPFLVFGVITGADILQSAEEAGRKATGVLGSLDQDQIVGLTLFFAGLMLMETGTHLIIAAIAAGAASAGTAAFIAAPTVIAGFIIDGFGIGLMLWGLLILMKTEAPPAS